MPPRRHKQIATKVDPEKEIMRLLEVMQCRAGVWLSQVFADLIWVCRATMLMAPRHAATMAETGSLAQDDEDTQKLFESLRSRYKSPTLEEFAGVLGMLVMESREGYSDLLGDTYMQVRCRGQGHALGQYFTPEALADGMASMVLSDGHEQVLGRLRTAGMRAGLSREEIEVLVSGPSGDFPATWEGLFSRITGHLEPFRIQEPCCGSGVMILATAKQFPRWAHTYGVVWYHANDLDRLCAAMCHLQMMLHGLTGMVTCGNMLTMDLEYFGSSPAYVHWRRVERTAAA